MYNAPKKLDTFGGIFTSKHTKLRTLSHKTNGTVLTLLTD